MAAHAKGVVRLYVSFYCWSLYYLYISCMDEILSALYFMLRGCDIGFGVFKIGCCAEVGC